jgi:hypothetical protein
MKVMSLSCLCEIERNNFKEKMLPNEKQKTLIVNKINEEHNGGKSDLEFIVKYTKTGQVVIQFNLINIRGVYD